MSVPDDADIVLAAVRLGWYVAEVRGRNRPDAPRRPGQIPPDRSGHALPLRAERTDSEMRIEAQVVLQALAARLGVDAVWGEWFRYSPSVDRVGKRLARLIAKRRPEVPLDDTKIPGEWDALAEIIYRFDAHIQDVLTAFSDSQACGYQLGRALAECYWALDPGITEPAAGPAPGARPAGPPPDSWRFLFGDERCQEMSRLLGRLSAYMHPYTAPAIAGSIEIWKGLAANIGDWRKAAEGKAPPGAVASAGPGSGVAGSVGPGSGAAGSRGPGSGGAATGTAAASPWFEIPQNALYLQVRRWYELVILKQDPTTLIKPYALLRHFRLIRQAARVFGAELALGALSAGALAGLAWALTRPQVAGWISTLLGVVAATGLSAAGLSARLKNTALAMFTRLRQDAYTDLVAVAISTCPPLPGPARRQRRAVAQAVQRRSLTPATPN